MNSASVSNQICTISIFSDSTCIFYTVSISTYLQLLLTLATQYYMGNNHELFNPGLNICVKSIQGVYNDSVAFSQYLVPYKIKSSYFLCP